MRVVSATEVATTGPGRGDGVSSRLAWLQSRLRLVVTFAGVAASAGLMAWAVPPSNWGALAWVALVPVVLAVQREMPWRAGLYGAVFGAASLAGMHSWLWQLSGFNRFDAVALLGYLALYPAVWCAALAWLARRRLPWVFPGALLWVLLDWLRSHAGPLALPWDPLAHSQIADLPVLQLAAWGGAPLLTFAVCLGNLALAAAWQKRSLPRLAWIAAALAAIHLGGYLAISGAPSSKGPRIAVIQPADEDAAPAVRLDRLRSLTREAAREQPDLIVWPESAVNGFAFTRALQRSVADVAHAVGAPILLGSADFGKFAKAADDAAKRIEFKNQAFLVLPDGTTQGPYTKNRLVPFGEYMPFESRLSWPRWLIAHQRHGIAGVAPGLFQGRDGVMIGVVICWENYFTELVRRLAQHEAAVIVQLSNDADFGASAEPAQHNAASILRAVEYGRPWVQVSANGPSLFIDPHGRIIESLGPIGASRWAVRAIPGVTATTLYGRFGLWWLWLASAAILVRIALHQGRRA